ARTSGENLFVVLLIRTPSTQELEPPTIPGRFTAAAAQRRELEQLGLSPGAIESVMRPFSVEIERAHFAPIMVIEPATELYDRLEFDPALIARNIERGRQAVRDQWSVLARFLGVAE
ncbi:hypothetical protein, partial [Qipengyuania sp. ASV99]|uniref:hypothetical protein n=1 Tax=Qipengyuania sp. ASV99 TaxID=3399681 RepID=UPI003A4C5ED1